MQHLATTFFAEDLEHLESQINDWINTAKAGNTIIQIVDSSITCIPAKVNDQDYSYGCLIIYTKHQEPKNQF